jgi:GNAT superfamily N-acetyltransferase
MHIIDFTTAHVERAAVIAKQNYDEERTSVPALPPAVNVPDLTLFAENGLGVAAFDGDTMLGYLCCVEPFQNAFGSTGAIGVFSPLGANGAVGDNRSTLYARLYQAAGEKWAEAGASSHAVCLYAHDKEVQGQFFRYGFGLRCIDAIRDINEIAIRGMDELAAPRCEAYDFSELAPTEHVKLYPFVELFNRHFLESPTFMVKPDLTKAEFSEGVKGFRFFAAHRNGELVAFLKAGCAGENFIRDAPGYIHADGAFCLPEHRGRGIMQVLLQVAVTTLKAEGYTYLGVDYESINPAAYGFWSKHFSAYTHSVTRRID